MLEKLSETEQRVAELVARGKTNQETADRLHVSPKTVEWNLTKVYRKLGVRSRTELALKARGFPQTNRASVDARTEDQKGASRSTRRSRARATSHGASGLNPGKPPDVR